VPISAIIFGGRHSTTVPLVLQGFNWTHGVYLGATMGSETTAAAVGKEGVVRRDPMAMLAFCGYHMGDYFAHWLATGRAVKHPPKVYRVNWFRRGADGRFLWPGYGENLRVLKWVVGRCHGEAGAVDTPVGLMPRYEDLDWTGLDYPTTRFDELSAVDREAWRLELRSHDELFARLGDRMPAELRALRDVLQARLDD
jgi:phosphoenolpyruvate carboxykinase (GTP)